MHVETFYPQIPILKKYIEYYYYLKTAPDFNETFYAFPNTLHSLNIHINANWELKPYFTTVFEDRSIKYLTSVQGHPELPLRVNLRGKLDKVTILFKPLGLNSFIKKSFKDVAGEHSQIFTEWDGNEYADFLDAFYKTSDNEKRSLLLENFLLTRYEPFEQEDVFQNAIDKLTDFENDCSIEEIAQSLSLNKRTFNRLFDKHLGVSPVAFRNIARFRHSMKNKLFSEKFKTLTEIGYESNFYDQSYFVKMYKKLTGKNPSKFFNSIEKLADDQLIFEFIKK